MAHPSPTGKRARAPRHGLPRFLPLLVFVLIGLLFLNENVPTVNSWIQGVLAPERHGAAQACRSAAMDAASHPDFARVRGEGTVHRTRNGFYVEGVEIGEMGENGAETVYRFDCYADHAGALVTTHKRAPEAEGAPDRQE